MKWTKCNREIHSGFILKSILMKLSIAHWWRFFNALKEKLFMVVLRPSSCHHLQYPMYLQAVYGTHPHHVHVEHPPSDEIPNRSWAWGWRWIRQVQMEERVFLFALIIWDVLHSRTSDWTWFVTWHDLCLWGLRTHSVHQAMRSLWASDLRDQTVSRYRSDQGNKIN